MRGCENLKKKILSLLIAFVFCFSLVLTMAAVSPVEHAKAEAVEVAIGGGAILVTAAILTALGIKCANSQELYKMAKDLYDNLPKSLQAVIGVEGNYMENTQPQTSMAFALSALVWNKLLTAIQTIFNAKGGSTSTVNGTQSYLSGISTGYLSGGDIIGISDDMRNKFNALNLGVYGIFKLLHDSSDLSSYYFYAFTTSDGSLDCNSANMIFLRSVQNNLHFYLWDGSNWVSDCWFFAFNYNSQHSCEGLLTNFLNWNLIIGGVSVPVTNPASIPYTMTQNATVWDTANNQAIPIPNTDTVTVAVPNTIDAVQAATAAQTVAISSAASSDLTMPNDSTINFEPLMQAFSDRFPFCIPFDLVNSIVGLAVPGVAPVFTVDFDSSHFVGGGSFSIDFSKFSVMAAVLRWAILIGFVVALIKLTRNIIKG
jgi:hypothetical protein